VADYFSVKYQTLRKPQPLESIEVQRDFAIHRKDRPIDYTRMIADHIALSPCSNHLNGRVS